MKTNSFFRLCPVCKKKVSLTQSLGGDTSFSQHLDNQKPCQGSGLRSEEPILRRFFGCWAVASVLVWFTGLPFLLLIISGVTAELVFGISPETLSTDSRVVLLSFLLAGPITALPTIWAMHKWG